MLTQSSEVSNRRRAPRIEGCLEVLLEATNRFAGARVTDLSEEGCYVDSIGQVTKDEPIRLQIQVPDGRPLVLRGVVAHHLPRLGFGVKFIDINDEQAERLKEVIAYLSQI